MSSTSQFGGDSEATSTVGADKPLRPTIVLLPGAWHNSSIFGPLTSLLQEKHFPTVVVDLPTSGADPPVKDAIEDVITIRKVLDRVLEAGEQVVLVAHSYSAMPCSMALHGLTRDELPKKGVKGYVKQFMLVAPTLVPVGQTINSYWLKGQSVDPAGFEIHPDYSSTVKYPDQIFFNDLTPEQAAHWRQSLQRESNAFHDLRLTYDAWNYFPTTFVLCLKDLISPVQEEKAIRKFIHNPNIVEIDTAHDPFIGSPAKMAAIIEKAAENTVP